MLKVTPVSERSCLLQLLTTPIDSAIIVPKRYFKASNELVFLTLIVTWIITLSYDYKLAWNHPARNFTGHLNPCFGWDYAPASYVAVFACAADVYLAWTYATLEAMRTHLRDRDGRIDRAERFSLVTTYLHGIAAMVRTHPINPNPNATMTLTCTASLPFWGRYPGLSASRTLTPALTTQVWMLLWLVGPPDNRWEWHLAIFSGAVFFRYLCTLGCVGVGVRVGVRSGLGWGWGWSWGWG